MLWIALHLPRLRLELFAAQARPEAEEGALCGVAAWAGQFTPRVSLVRPATVLLEVSGSLKLFKGLAAMLRLQRAGLAAMGHSARMAAAPTATAAAWLACAGVEKVVSAARLAAVLAPLPVALALPRRDAATLVALGRIGVKRLGELAALPREGCARRFGRELLDELDRALGRLPDPRIWFVPPSSFSAGVELEAEANQAEALLFAARRLVLQLCGYLAGRGLGVQRFNLDLLHEDLPPTACVIGLVAPAADAAHFLRLLRERLSRLPLPRPVIGLLLWADAMTPRLPESLRLFADGAQATGEAGKLVEKLRARLGAAAVHGLAIAAEHRPERASLAVDIAVKRGGQPSSVQFAERPLWLLAQPALLSESGQLPQYQGRLRLISGPERIESGWWDGADIGRDYFVAESRSEALLWIYRERQLGGGWYLHGYFA